MAKKTPNNNQVFGDAQSYTRSINYLDKLDDNRQDDFLDVPDKMQPYINNWIREGHKKFITLDIAMKSIPKDSDEYTYLDNMMSGIGKSWVKARKQIDTFKMNQDSFKDIVPSINAGTKEENLHANLAVYGNEWDNLGIDDDGEFMFGVGDNGYKLNAMPPIVDEPFVGKNYVFKLAEQIKALKDQNRPFDGAWVYRNALDNINKTGPEGIIGLAHTDLAGDGLSKTFAQMWEEGLADKTLYSNPEHDKSPFKIVDDKKDKKLKKAPRIGPQKIPVNLSKDPDWMKNPANTSVLAGKLAQHITNVVGDIYYGGTKPEVEIAEQKTRRAKVSQKYGAVPSVSKTMLLPVVSTVDSENKSLVADTRLNQEVNKYLQQTPTETTDEKVKNMPPYLYDYYVKRISELAKSQKEKHWEINLPGGSYYGLLKELHAWRKPNLTPAELIKKYS